MNEDKLDQQMKQLSHGSNALPNKFNFT